MERSGNIVIPLHDGGKATRKRILADLAWQIATTGRAIFPNGEELTLEPGDWIGVFKFLYQHIDGPPLQNVDLTSGGNPLKVVIEYATDDSDDAAE